ncbi:hypothetical protein ACFVT2_07395 [Streptomyces sp. NPDC058000]|uniref:hypothetical protein n=1 Tax=Streptomyces sp. NPDC058000 TaxID=3346299 RepID=UPI0036E3D957
MGSSGNVVVADLERRLANRGRGTRVEIDPADQPQVAPRHRRDVEIRSLNVRGLIWDRTVDAWIAHDAHDARELEAIWDETIQGGLGTDWDAYTYVPCWGQQSDLGRVWRRRPASAGRVGESRESRASPGKRLSAHSDRRLRIRAALLEQARAGLPAVEVVQVRLRCSSRKTACRQRMAAARFG